MELTNDMIRQLADLSRLEFDDADIERLRGDLSRMIGFVEKLQELDTTGIEPVLHMTENLDILRADVLEPSLDRKRALDLAPDANEQYFFVPKVIKK